jgi:hypothetical protein
MMENMEEKGRHLIDMKGRLSSWLIDREAVGMKD